MKTKKIVISAIIILSLMLLMVILFIYNTTFYVDISNGDETKKVLLSQFGSTAENVNIHKITIQDDMILVLYSDNESGYIGLKIFEKSLPVGSRYKSRGSASSSSKKVNTYSFAGKIEKSNGLVVVFGDNTSLGASSYTFESDGQKYEAKIKEDYFIDVYTFDEMLTSNVSGLILYNENDEPVPSY